MGCGKVTDGLSKVGNTRKRVEMTVDLEELNISELRQRFEDLVSSSARPLPLSDNPVTFADALKACKDRFENVKAQYLEVDNKERFLHAFHESPIEYVDAKDLQQAENDVVERKQAMLEQQQQNEDLYTEAELLIREIVDKQTTAQETYQKNTETESEIEELKRQLELLEHECKTLEPPDLEDEELNNVSYEDLGRLETKYQNVIETLEVENSAVSDNLKTLESESKDLEAKLKSANDTLATLEADNSELAMAQEQRFLSDQHDARLAVDYYKTMMATLAAFADFKTVQARADGHKTTIVVESTCTGVKYSILASTISGTVLDAVVAHSDPDRTLPSPSSAIKDCAQYPPELQLTAFLRNFDSQVLQTH